MYISSYHKYKFLFDYLTVIILSPLWIPLIIILSILIKIKEPSFPIFYIQERVGRNGQMFRMIKFRSMIPNKSSDSITSKDDSRITDFGAFLRKWKLDELPELINVFLGDMSLVGPRPDVKGYADKLHGENRLILKLKPGITGPASLKYANEEEILASVKDKIWYNDNIIFPDKVKINLQYYYCHTIWIDIRLIFQTLFFKRSRLERKQIQRGNNEIGTSCTHSNT